MNSPFRSFMMGGFECSTHLLRSGRRLDLVTSTRHDTCARADYRRLRRLGMRTARDGVRWHLIEAQRGRFDFSSARPMIDAALQENVQVAWDMLHFGWPDHVDVFAPEFPQRLADFAQAFARVLREAGEEQPLVCPVNEISFLSFAGGQAGFFNPWAQERGDELKAQLVRASLAAGRALRAENSATRLVHTDPLINVVAHPSRPEQRAAAAAHYDAQFHAWDMIAGRRQPGLGGSESDLDILGINYYVHNQWFYPGGHNSMVSPSSELYRPVHQLLIAAGERYRRPMFVAETGIEDEARPSWLAYIAHEVRLAERAGAQVHGICLYPIVNHPGWEDDRHCHNGLWDYVDSRCRRPVYRPLADEIRRAARVRRRPHDAAAQAFDAHAALAGLEHIARAIAEATESTREG